MNFNTGHHKISLLKNNGIVNDVKLCNLYTIDFLNKINEQINKKYQNWCVDKGSFYLLIIQ